MKNRKDDPIMWTLGMAIELVNQLSPLLRTVDHEVGLLGSVLFKGDSSHDLDLVVFPLRTTTTFTVEDVRKVLEDFGMKLEYDEAFVKRMWARVGSKDQKHVEGWLYEQRRIDLFFLK